MPRPSPKRKSPTWKIMRLKASPAAFVGLVDAPDEEKAVKEAIRVYRIPPEHRKRLLALRWG